MLAAAPVDPLFEIERAAERRLEDGIARRHPLHGAARVAMAAGARLPGGSALGCPQCLALQDRQHPGVRRVVILHRPGFRRGEIITGPAVFGCDLGRRSRHCNGGDRHKHQPFHSTVMCLTSVWVWPRSSVQLKAISPLSVATVKKAMNGFAAIAGWSSARNTSSPL